MSRKSVREFEKRDGFGIAACAIYGAAFLGLAAGTILTANILIGLAAGIGVYSVAMVGGALLYNRIFKGGFIPK